MNFLRKCSHALSLLTAFTLISGSLTGHENPREEKFVKWVEQKQRQGTELSQRVMNCYDKVKNRSTSGEASLVHLERSSKNHPKRKLAQENYIAFDAKFNEEHKKRCCDKKIVLTSKDFGHKGLQISKPGYYCLAENVTFDPQSDNVPAITISSDYVILNFGHHKLAHPVGRFF
jgi:hypothetical protein